MSADTYFSISGGRRHKSSHDKLSIYERRSRVPGFSNRDRASETIVSSMGWKPGGPRKPNELTSRTSGVGYSADVPASAEFFKRTMPTSVDVGETFDPLDMGRSVVSIVDEVMSLPDVLSGELDPSDVVKDVQDRVSNAREIVRGVSDKMLDLSSTVLEAEQFVLDVVPGGHPVLDDLREKVSKLSRLAESPMKVSSKLLQDMARSTNLVESVLNVVGSDVSSDEMIVELLSTMGQSDAARLVTILRNVADVANDSIDGGTMEKQAENLDRVVKLMSEAVGVVDNAGLASAPAARKIRRVLEVADKGVRIARIITSVSATGILEGGGNPASTIRTVIAAVDSIASIAGEDISDIVSKANVIIRVASISSSVSNVIDGLSSGSNVMDQLESVERITSDLEEATQLAMDSGLLPQSAMSTLETIASVAGGALSGARAGIESTRGVSEHVYENISLTTPRPSDPNMPAAVSVTEMFSRTETGWTYVDEDFAPRTSTAVSSIRQNSARKGLPSIPSLGTDFSNTGNTPRDVVEAVDSSVVGDAIVAVPADGFGDIIQDDDSVITQPKPTPREGPVGPLDGPRWRAYADQVAATLGGGYSSVNPVGMLGRYQFSAADLIDEGYVVPGTSSRSLHVQESWTGRDGMTSRVAFLGSSDVQDRMFLNSSRRLYKSLLRCGIVTRSDDPCDVAAMMGVAQVVSFGAAHNLSDGVDRPDSWGTRASDVASTFANAVPSGVPEAETTRIAAALGADTRDQMSTYVGSTIVEDGRTAVFPSSDSSMTKYPHNKVTQHESGHFKEYDSTPGAERIQERHRTGTGYEIDASGSQKVVIVADSYRAVMGSDTLIVHGHCNIVVMGDVGIKADGDININSGRDLNMLVGGDYNLTVGGNHTTRVDGSRMVMVRGDSADNVVGWRREGVDGDFFLEAASINGVARSTEVNMAAETNANFVAKKTTHVLGQEKLKTTTGGDHVESVGGNRTSIVDKARSDDTSDDHTVTAARINLN